MWEINLKCRKAFSAPMARHLGEAAMMDNAYRAMLSASPTPPSGRSYEDAPTHRHKKRGTGYVLVGYGKMQAESWVDKKPSIDALMKEPPEVSPPPSVDMREVAIYRSVDDGSLWVRPREEFEDGRFEALANREGA